MSVTDGTVLKLVVSFLWTDGNINQNVYNAVLTGAGSPWDEADVVDDADAWLDNMYANIVGAMSDELDGNELNLYKYDAVDGDWDEIGSQGWTFNPTGTNDQLPRGSAPLVRLWSSDPDVQGKKYIPGMTEGSLVDGLYNAALLTDLLAFAVDWYTPFTGAVSGATWTPGIWSVVGSVFKAAIDHYAVSSIPAYQRRRKRTVGI